MPQQARREAAPNPCSRSTARCWLTHSWAAAPASVGPAAPGAAPASPGAAARPPWRQQHWLPRRRARLPRSGQATSSAPPEQQRDAGQRGERSSCQTASSVMLNSCCRARQICWNATPGEQPRGRSLTDQGTGRQQGKIADSRYQRSPGHDCLRRRCHVEEDLVIHRGLRQDPGRWMPRRRRHRPAALRAHGQGQVLAPG